MTNFRWWIFKRLSSLGWWICPEPHRTNLQRATVSWAEYAKYLDANKGKRR
jgi:hypothetical protein